MTNIKPCNKFLLLPFEGSFYIHETARFTQIFISKNSGPIISCVKGSKNEYRVEVIRTAREEENMGSYLTLKVSKGEKPLWVKGDGKNKWKDVKFDIEEQNINRVKCGEVSGGGTYVVNNCKFDEINIRDRGLSDKNGEHKAEEIKLETIVCKGWIFSKKLLKALN